MSDTPVANQRVCVLHWNTIAVALGASDPDIHYRPFLADGGVLRPFSACAINQIWDVVLEIVHTSSGIPS
jgi:hypothetical protein